LPLNKLSEVFWPFFSELTELCYPQIMSFISLQYYAFLAFAVVVFHALPARVRGLFLLLASYLFYVSFEPRAIFFILATTIVSYVASSLMSSSENSLKRKLALGIALCLELTFLAMTKYFNPIALSTGWFSPIKILIPLGISFYTFQTIGYLFDVYRGHLEAEKNFLRYALFLSFFPHLLAGPIEPAQHFLPQLKEENSYKPKLFIFGVLLILVGLFKKLVIADRLGMIVNLVYDNPSEYHGGAIALATLLARYQIYADFSGYTDIALGSAMLFGFELTPNFNRPFSATSIGEYWKRWHMSLSTWIRNYIFFPLITSPISFLGAPILVLLTFLILGIWHGGTVNFLIYGLIQGSLIVIDYQTQSLRVRIFEKLGFNRFPRALKLFSIMFTFLVLVVPPTLFFRAANFSDAKTLLSNLFSQAWSKGDFEFIQRSAFLIQCLKIALPALVIYEIGHWTHSHKHLGEFIFHKPMALFYLVIISMLMVIAVFGFFEMSSSFIYTQF
jgi:alginate O-acetyltransferase complex protein AlgI